MNIGVWAYLDNNVGDDLMIKLLAKNFKDHNFFIYSNKSIIRNTFKDFNNISVKNSNNVYNDLKVVKVYVFIGGSIFNNLNSIKGKVLRLKRIKFLNKLKHHGIKIATIGCNLGPYNDNLGLFLTKQELRKNDLITVRDKISYDIIKGFKTIKNYHLADDIVYLLEIEKNTNEQKDILGVTAYRCLKGDECNFDNYLALSRIIDIYIEKTNNYVKIFAFDSENENDLSAAYHIYELCNNKNNIRIVPYLGNSDYFLDEFSSCSRNIVIRFHGAVLSHLMGIPFLPIIYSNKMSNFLNDNGYKGDLITLDKLTIDTIAVEEIVEKLVSLDGLFKCKKNSIDSHIHFAELEKLISDYE